MITNLQLTYISNYDSPFKEFLCHLYHHRFWNTKPRGDFPLQFQNPFMPQAEVRPVLFQNHSALCNMRNVWKILVSHLIGARRLSHWIKRLYCEILVRTRTPDYSLLTIGVL